MIPREEIRKAQVKIFNAKLKIRDWFKELELDTGRGVSLCHRY
jgi:hypothetical protein